MIVLKAAWPLGPQSNAEKRGAQGGRGDQDPALRAGLTKYRPAGIAYVAVTATTASSEPRRSARTAIAATKHATPAAAKAGR